MGVFDFITDRFKKTPEPEITKTILPPQIQEPVRAVDVGTPTQERVGGVTIRGESVIAPRTPRQQIVQQVTGERPQVLLPSTQAAQLKQQLVVEGLTQAQAAAVAKREQLKQVAKVRGRPFTRTEAQRFIGGGQAVSQLRQARRRGATPQRIQEIRQELSQGDIQELQFQRGQRSSGDFLFGGDTVTPQPALRIVEEEGFFPQPVQAGRPLLLGREVGREGEEAEQIFEVEPQGRVGRLLSRIGEESSEQERLRQFEQQTSFRELFEQGQLPSIVRKGAIEGGEKLVGLAEIIQSSIRGTKPLPQEQRARAGEFVGETLLFAGFLPFATTAQTARAVQPTTVAFGGAAQRIEGRLIRTDVLFKTSKDQVGFARGVSSIKQQGDLAVSTTIGKGITGRSVFVPPSIQRVLKPQEAFIGLQRSITQNLLSQSGFFRQISRGDIIRASTRESTRLQTLSGTLGRTRGGRTFSVGGTISDQGNLVKSFGLITEKETAKQLGFRGSTGVRFGTTLNQLFAQQSLTDLQSIVRSSIQSQSKSTANVVSATTPSLRIETVRPQPTVSRQPTQLNLNQLNKEISKLSQTQFQFPALRISGRTRTRAVTRIKQEVVPRVSSITRVRQIDITRQIPRQAFRLFTPQVTRNLFRFPTPTPSPTPTRPFEEIPFIPFRPRRTRERIPTLGNFITEVRRFGIFRPIGRARTLGQAIGLGARRVSRTLAATFRIRGGRAPTRVPGFRTKREREGLVFIEPRRRRLGTPTEVAEIQKFLRKSVRRRRR